ncbi:MAG: hypothetical protein AVDCRST_MAG16-2024 [uncultured Frankineae bacterium]|uniref:Uncharacterized protein n=1 Tax=uncultured Frankineae bacterium TaxID=437475 RepID=A0A6J4LZ36_9ACTN|nr:MAG: hypothetical protein AVDCRST_MAG16-2024 [uncultured Frankineae bacterium]
MTGLDGTGLVGPDHALHPVTDPQLGQDVAHVRRGGGIPDDERPGDLGVASPRATSRSTCTSRSVRRAVSAPARAGSAERRRPGRGRSVRRAPRGWAVVLDQNVDRVAVVGQLNAHAGLRRVLVRALVMPSRTTRRATEPARRRRSVTLRKTWSL